MLRYVVAVVVFLAAVDGCQITGYKSVGSACGCSDVCLGNSFCQRDGRGGFVCQCSVCQYYEPKYGQCVDIPEYGKPCNSQCASNFVCNTNGSGCGSCQCQAYQSYDQQTNACVSYSPCVNNNNNGCANLPNGDYPACYPECQKGVYITCSNKYRYVRDCALGWYVKPNGERFTEKLVYDPQLKRCERRTASCPRTLDSQVEGK